MCRFLLNLVRGRWCPGTGLAEARLAWLSGFAWFVVTGSGLVLLDLGPGPRLPVAVRVGLPGR